MGARVICRSASTWPNRRLPAGPTVTATAEGWRLVCTNSNRAGLHPWGQAASWPERNKAIALRWPRVALRLIGSVRDAQHWVLLEADRYELPGVGQVWPGPGSTNTQSPASWWCCSPAHSWTR